MTVRQLNSLVISLIGFYFLSLSILGSGAAIVTMVLSAFQGEWRIAGFTAIGSIVQFVVPFVVGMIFVRRSERLGAWVCQQSKVDESLPVSMPNLEKVSFLAFALLGLYLLGESVPSALSTVALWFHTKAGETHLWSRANGFSFQEFWEIQFPLIAYHVAAVGFSAFVFFRGKSLSKFVWSLRR